MRHTVREVQSRKGMVNYPDEQNHEIVVWENGEPVRGYIGDIEVDYVRDGDYLNLDCC